MGGKIAYELEKRLEKRGKTAQCFLVSGSRIPSIPERNPIYHLPDDEFKKALGRFEGTPKEILENQELLDFFLPMLRASFCTFPVVTFRMRIVANICGMQQTSHGVFFYFQKILLRNDDGFLIGESVFLLFHSVFVCEDKCRYLFGF